MALRKCGPRLAESCISPVPPLCLINNLTFKFLCCNSSVAVLLLKDQIFIVDLTKIFLIVQFNSLCS